MSVLQEWRPDRSSLRHGRGRPVARAADRGYASDRPHAAARGRLRRVPDNDMTRVARAERNIERCLKQRPDQRGEHAGLEGRHGPLSRGARPRGAAGRPNSARYYQQARDSSRRPAKRTSGNDGVPAIIGGSLRSSAIGCRRSIAPPRGRRPTTTTHCCGSCRTRPSTSCRCTSRANCWRGWRNRRSAPAARKRRRSSSTRC